MPILPPVLALHAFQDNYIWIIKNETGFICIDPGDASPVLAFAEQENLTLETILITHNHADHIGGVNELKQHFPEASVYTPEHVNTCIHLDTYAFDVLETPGHTHNHVCYFEPSMAWLFCGDTLFSAGCGRVFGGSLSTLYASLEKIKALPDATQVFCAHEYTRQNLRFALTVEPGNQAARTYLNELEANPKQNSLPSNIGLEKQVNPFLRLDSPEVRDFVLAHHGNAETAEGRFNCLRTEKDCFQG